MGEGTFGKVKLGHHIPTKEKVAIKVLEKNKIVEPEDLERVNREIRFLKKLNNKNIIKIYEVILFIYLDSREFKQLLYHYGICFWRRTV